MLAKDKLNTNNLTLFSTNKKIKKDETETNKIKIAILGAGTGGLFAAISLMKKYGDKVEVSIFDKQPSFDLEKGVELSISPTFQLAMLEIGLDIQKLRDLGYPFTHDQRVRNKQFELIDTIEKSLEGQHTGYYADVVFDEALPTRLQLYEYSTKRGIVMDFLYNELLRVNGHKETIHWNSQLQEIISSASKKKKLIFADGKESEEFDLIIGADGVHSQVRKGCFDQEPPHHVGANILYGVIPGDIKNFEPNTFHIIADDLTIVLGHYIEADKAISTWWAVIYPDQKNIENGDIAFWEKRNDAEFIKKFATELAIKNNNPVLKDLIKQTPIANFKYSGKFLERNPLTLAEWGKDNVVLVGDAIHAMMPWAGVGAGMAAEDVLILLSLFEQYHVLENRETFENLLANNSFEEIYKEYKEKRINRITYFYIMTHQMAPEGILSADNLNGIDIKAKYGNQHALTSSPHFNDLLLNQLASSAARDMFFEKIDSVAENENRYQRIGLKL